MANIISLNTNTPISECLQMSNSCTSVFICGFGLSGSRLAKSEQEKRLIKWLLERNQAFLGIGMVGFKICDMPWNKESFEVDKRFLVSVLNGIRNKLGWDTLDFVPNEELLFSCTDTFEHLLEGLSLNAINIENTEEWLEQSLKHNTNFQEFLLCPKHKVLLTLFGCQVCTDC